APPLQAPRRTLPREVILLVDHSGSMEGAKWEAADWAVAQFLAGLTGEDSFNLGLFHNTTRWFSPEPRPATPEAVASARQFLEAHRDSGGTELGVALEQALGMERQRGDRARHVLVITDAEVTDAGRILRLADQEWQRPDHRRISVLCIDAAPNSLLAAELAERGGGIARFLTSAAEEEDITTALDALLVDWAQPAVVGLRLLVDRPDAQAGGRHVERVDSGHAAIDLGDLPCGRTIWVVGRATRADASALQCRLTAADGQELAAAQAALGAGAASLPALKALFGARRVLGLEFLMRANYDEADLRTQLAWLGYNPAQALADQGGHAPGIYAENIRAAHERALRALLVREALAYGLASSETAFVAVRTERGQPVEGTVVVANALPAGWSERFHSGGMAAPAPVAYRAMAAPPGSPAPGQMAGALRDSLAQAQSTVGRVADRLSAITGGRQRPHAISADVFTGVPRPHGGEAVLFDSATPAAMHVLPDTTTLTRLRVRFPDGAPEPLQLDGDLSLLLFVDDPAAPRAQVRLVDLARQDGERPLHIAKRAGERVWLVLSDPAGAWATGAPRIAVTLEWRDA
ncbi:MAG TPA: VWA domain-containing protein, partial [Chloroflexota bacterium]|nr:VWA domain-containing protein [Chloroflexota bacterium]